MMKSFFRKMAFVMTLAMIVSLTAPAEWVYAAEGGIALQGKKNVVTEYELKMAEFNAAHYPKAKTILLETDPDLKEISSTIVRKAIENNQPLTDYLPPKAIKAVEKIREKIRDKR